MCRRAGFCITTLLFALIIPCWKAESSNDNVDNTSVFISVIPEKGKDISELCDVIFEVTVLELNRLGYTTFPALTENDTHIRQEEEDSILEIAEENYASSLVLIKYTMEERNALLKLSLFDVDDRVEKAAITMSGEIDLSFDRTIAESLNELLEQSGIGPPVVAGKRKDNDGTGPEKVGSTTAGQVRFPRPDAEIYADKTPDKFLRISAGFAPFIALGRTRSYFSIGIEPSILLEFIFNGPLDFLQIGMLLRTTLFRARGVLLETDNMLISAAPDIRFVISPSSTFNIHLHVAGGPSGFFLKNERVGEYWKFVPFVSGGGGVSFALSSAFGLTANVDYSVYFEKSICIMGISPSMHAVFNF